MKKAKSTVTYSPVIPKTVSVREVQRTYRAVSDRLQREGTLMVMNFSEPDMILLSKKEFETLHHKIAKLEEKLEEQQILSDFEEYKKEKKAGTLKVLRSLKDLR